ncbi:hypothetical protein COL26b_010127 [Colletotrichum chrysophilum]|uniref:uncharacterized protein n=1 Tax=Colletotrichum chrysophilum TaxID=1836956 RepID=UPI0023003ADC|nr:uncharacterized protein COL26b_010127 [Colletotrichum chrysophilum]KAJ0370118.1 hypothetical protein COL26b_010127 [Colletotrichum chrysophilum]
MANSQEHATTSVDDIAVYKGDLIGELRKAQHILRDIVRDSRCCVCWDVLQKTYVGQCGHSICMKIDHIYEPLRLWAVENMSTETGELTTSPEIVPRRLEHGDNYQDDKNCESDDDVPGRLELAGKSQDDNNCESTEETMEPFHWAALLLIVGTFILL